MFRMQRTRTPIFIRLGNRRRKHSYAQHGLRGVMIENIHASESLLASSITGLKGVEVHDVTLSNIHIDNVLPSRPEWIGHTVPEKEDSYPEARMFGMLPASGLYVRHVRGLRVKDLAFNTAAGEARPAVLLDDVRNLRIAGLSGSPVIGSEPFVSMKDTQDAWISDSAAPIGTQTYLKAEGAASSNILLSGCDMRGAQNAVELGSEISPEAVTVEGNIHATPKKP
jgi:hypothetical protein